MKKRCEKAQKRCEIVDKEEFSYENPCKPYIFLKQLIRRREREERDRMRGGEAHFLTNHRDSEKHNYHSFMKINCHVDPVVPPRQLALVSLDVLI